MNAVLVLTGLESLTGPDFTSSDIPALLRGVPLGDLPEVQDAFRLAIRDAHWNLRSVGRTLGFLAKAANRTRAEAGKTVLLIVGRSRLGGARWGFRTHVGPLADLTFGARIEKPTFDPQTSGRLAEVAKRLSRPGLSLTVDDALRMAVAEGLRALESEANPTAEG